MTWFKEIIMADAIQGNGVSRMAQVTATTVANMAANPMMAPVIAFNQAANQAALFGATTSPATKADSNFLSKLFGGSGDKAAAERSDKPAGEKAESTKEWCSWKNCTQCGSCGNGSCSSSRDIATNESSNLGEQDSFKQASTQGQESNLTQAAFNEREQETMLS